VIASKENQLKQFAGMDCANATDILPYQGAFRKSKAYANPSIGVQVADFLSIRPHRASGRPFKETTPAHKFLRSTPPASTMGVRSGFHRPDYSGRTAGKGCVGYRPRKPVGRSHGPLPFFDAGQQGLTGKLGQERRPSLRNRLCAIPRLRALRV
jgi:hypothetical protein